MQGSGYAMRNAKSKSLRQVDALLFRNPNSLPVMLLDVARVLPTAEVVEHGRADVRRERSHVVGNVEDWRWAWSRH